MTILNMVGWWASWPKVPLDAISVFTVEWWDTEATIKWTDPTDLTVNWVLITSWSSTKLVRKIGSAPANVNDWTLVLTETTRNTYSSTWYTDTWLTNGTTYYYAAFAIADNWLVTISSTTPSVTPEQWWWTPWANTLAYYDFETDTSALINKASSWSTYDWTYYNTPTIWTLASGKKYFNCSWNNYAATPVIPFDWSWFTINMRMYVPTTQNHEWYVLWTKYYTVTTLRIYEWCYNWSYDIAIWWDNNWYNTNRSNLSWWKLHTFISDWTHTYIYIDGVLIGTYNYTASTTNTDNFWIGMLYEQKHQTAKCFEWYFGSVMFENKVRTATEISDYYNQTKWDYWL